MPEKDLTRVVSKLRQTFHQRKPCWAFLNVCGTCRHQCMWCSWSRGHRRQVFYSHGPSQKRDGTLVFSGTLVEIMKQNGRGEKGHIGFHVDDLPAAEKWFEARGFEIDESFQTSLPDGGIFVLQKKTDCRLCHSPNRCSIRAASGCINCRLLRIMCDWRVRA